MIPRKRRDVLFSCSHYELDTAPGSHRESACTLVNASILHDANVGQVDSCCPALYQAWRYRSVLNRRRGHLAGLKLAKPRPSSFAAGTPPSWDGWRTADKSGADRRHPAKSAIDPEPRLLPTPRPASAVAPVRWPRPRGLVTTVSNYKATKWSFSAAMVKPAAPPVGCAPTWLNADPTETCRRALETARCWKSRHMRISDETPAKKPRGIDFQSPRCGGINYLPGGIHRVCVVDQVCVRAVQAPPTKLQGLDARLFDRLCLVTCLAVVMRSAILA